MKTWMPKVGDVYYHPATDRLGVVIWAGDSGLAFIDGQSVWSETGVIVCHTWIYAYCPDVMIYIGKL